MRWFDGVTVSTWDSESQDPSSNLGRTLFFFQNQHATVMNCNNTFEHLAD